jgi:hypothetical protein
MLEPAKRTLIKPVTTFGPLVIGATGGSGTRVVARLVRHAGYDLGRNLNSAEDALEFYSFHDKWINRFVSSERRGETLPRAEAEQMESEFQSAVDRHCPEMVRRERHWGWKAPRSIYLLPFLHRQFPGLKFIHVLRDGRDMVLSPNQNQLRKHSATVLNWRERVFCSAPERAMLLWQRANLRAAEFGESTLRESYLRIRFEALCANPVETTAQIMNFLGARVDPEPIARSEITPPSTLQRWRTYPTPLIAKLERLGAVSLQKFEYLA